MLRIMLLLIATLPFSGCGEAEVAGPNIEGRWKPAPEVLEAIPEGPPRETMAKMVVTFGPDGRTSTVDNKGKTIEGTYEVKSVVGNQVTIESTAEGQVHELVLTISGDEMTMASGPGEFKFVRD